MLKMFLMIIAILSVVCFSACIPKQSGEGGIPAYKVPPLKNYALASNGAKVRASGSTHSHPPELAINGITDSSGWHSGEGWECEFSLKSYYRPGYGYYWWGHDYWDRRYWDDWAEDLRYLDESAWIKISLPVPKKISRVVVHAYYSKKRVRYGLGEVLIQGWDRTRWLNLAQVKDGFIYYPTRSKPEQGQYEFTFVPIETDQIRVFILRGDKKSMRKLQTGGGQHVEEHWARIVEIEVTGDETLNEKDTIEEDMPVF